MKKNTEKETFVDVEERNVTLAIMDMFSSMAQTGMTEDILALVCKSLVRFVKDIQFAFYCYADAETGFLSVAQEGLDVFCPPPDVHRQLVLQLRRETKNGRVSVIAPQKAPASLPAEQRKKWRLYTCVAVDVPVNGASAATLAVYLKTDFAVGERHLLWMKLFRDIVSSFLAKRAAIVRCRTERDDAVRQRQATSLEVEALRSRVHDHLTEITRIGEDCRAGALCYKEGAKAVQKSAKALFAMANPVRRSPVLKGNALSSNPELDAWIAKGMKDPRVKVVSGIRGSRKSIILHEIRDRVLSAGVKESHVAFIDFENALFRGFKTVEDVLRHLEKLPKTKNPVYVLLDEIGMVSWDAELLSRLAGDCRWNVWAATSSAHTLKLSGEGRPLDLLIYHSWPDAMLPRSRSELEKIWGQIFMRDASGDSESQDIRAKEALAEYCSEHLGEVRSLREISKELRVGTHCLSTMSIRSYRQSLVDSHLIEFSPIYDTFEGGVVARSPGRPFYTDLELRNWRFGIAQTQDPTRVALNRLYLDLRRTYDVVYTPRDCDADFVTLDSKGKTKLWSIPKDPIHTPELFRPCARGGGKL